MSARGTTRRNVATGAGLSLLALAASSITAAHAASDCAASPDAKLIALAERHKEINQESDAISDKYGDEFLPDSVFEYLSGLSKRGHAIAEEMADITATTIEGLRAKASVMLVYTCHWADGSPIWTNHDELMGWSLARDILGRDRP